MLLLNESAWGFAVEKHLRNKQGKYNRERDLLRLKT